MQYEDTTVVIPVRDEPKVWDVVEEVFKKLPGCKVIVIYKGSLGNADRSRAGLRIIEQLSTGKGMAMIESSKQVDTRIMCFIDGDGTYDANDLAKAIGLVREGADLALGARLNLGKGAMPAKIRFGNWVLTFAANVLFRMRISDSQTGLRAIKKSVFEELDLHEPYFGIEEEMNIKAKKNRFAVKETPISYYPRKDSVAQHSKNIGGFRLLGVIFKLRFR